jgi:hypothetical protein
MCVRAAKRAIGPLLLAIAFVGSCSGSGDDDGDGSDPAAVAACTEYARELCRRSLTCRPAGVSAGSGAQEACVESVTLFCQRQLRAKGTHQTPETMSSCAKALAPLSCEDAVPTVCDAPPGDLPNGAPCFLGSQCQSGKCLSNVVPVVCGTCSDLDDLGSFCDRVSCPLPQSCRGGRCFTDVRLDEGESCGWGTPCRFPLVCLGRTQDVDGICSRPLPEGAPCEISPPNTQCDPTKGLSCDATTRKCTAVPPTPGLGQPCRSGVCIGGAFCNPFNNVCERLPRPGESCLRSNGNCFPPSVCNAVQLPDGGDDDQCVILDPNQCK